MKNSIITDDLEHCIVCGRGPVQLHHVFYGRNRKNADEDGLIIPLCFEHHTGSKRAIHFDPPLDGYWKRIAQHKYEEHHTREQFRVRYGRSYL